MISSDKIRTEFKRIQANGVRRFNLGSRRFGEGSVFRVGGRLFAKFLLGNRPISVGIEPLEQLGHRQFIGSHPTVFVLVILFEQVGQLALRFGVNQRTQKQQAQ